MIANSTTVNHHRAPQEQPKHDEPLFIAHEPFKFSSPAARSPTPHFFRSSKPIVEEGQGQILIHVKAAQAGLATTHGWWQFEGYGEWVREDTGTTVR